MQSGDGLLPSEFHRSRYFEKTDLDNSPSKRDGFTAEQEALWRRRYIRLIEQTAAKTHM